MLAGYPIFNGLAPEISDDGSKGPKALFYNWSFDVGGATEQNLELYEEATSRQLDFVQSIYFHNDSGSVFTLYIPVHQQTIQIAAQTQGWLPVFTMKDPQFRLTIGAAATVVLPMHFINVPMAPFVQTIT